MKVKVTDLSTLEVKRVDPISTRVMRRALAWKTMFKKLFGTSSSLSEHLRTSWQWEKGNA